METTLNIFRFELVQAFGTNDMFSQPHSDNPYQTPLRLMESYFENRFKELKVPREKKDVLELYHMEVLRLLDHVALVTLENNKTKTVTNNKVDQKVQHHPWCRIVFDLREGRQLIAVEASSAFGTDGLALCRLLKAGFDEFLRTYHLGINIQAMRKREQDLWVVLHGIVNITGDKVTQVKFDFADAEEQAVGRSRHAIIDTLIRMARQSGCQSAFLLEGSKDSVPLETIKDDLSMVAAYCMKNPRYKLTIRFKNYGIYRVGGELEARFAIDLQMLTDFEQGFLTFSMGSESHPLSLPEWLDCTFQLLTDFKDGTVVKRRKRGMVG